METKNILTPEEVTITQMALSGLIEDLTATSKDQTLNLNPEARLYTRQMLKAAKSAHEKLAKSSGANIQLEQYNPGDEDEFLTKQS